jgi:hypothetical protein
MSTEAKTDIDLTGGAGGVRSEPGGRAQRPAGGARPGQGPPRLELPQEVRDRLSDEVIDELLAGARSEEEIVGRRSIGSCAKRSRRKDTSPTKKPPGN